MSKNIPNIKLKVNIVRGVGNGDTDIADRALAAMKTNSDPQADVIEFDTNERPDLVQAGLWQKLDATVIPNAKDVLQGLQTSDYSMPYRGSQVLLAYDSSQVKDSEVPHTFADLITWIKAHPGQFVYCRPDKGGSGGNFVVRAIYEVTGKDPSIFKPGEPDPALVAQFPKAWALLRSIHPDIYDKGAYPSGNTQVLTLLGNGSVSMATVWSDQALQALASGVAAGHGQADPAHRRALPRRRNHALRSQEQPERERRGGFHQLHAELRRPDFGRQGYRRLPGGELGCAAKGTPAAVYQRHR